jgi:DNA-binding beta-propeller fold protein YncE
LPRRSATLLFLAILFLGGCVISPRRGSSSGGGGGGNGTGQLYVSDQGGNAILRFSGATRANGNIRPAATIAGANTTLSGPQYIFSDAANDRLYVANLNGADVLVFEKVSTLSGNSNTAPGRTITAIPSTNLTTPTDVAVDTGRNLLYVADSATNAVVVFTGASTANGATPVSRVLSLGFTPSAILLDAGNDRLFVADGGHNAVDVFNGASTLANGSITATTTLSGANTQLNQPAGLRIDGAGRLIVSNGTSPGSITIYSNAASLNTNQAPVAVISGSSTTFSSPAQLAIDPTTNSGELYVADPNAGEVAVFSNITTTTGNQNVAPNRNITGSNTNLTGTGVVTARGVALDTTH